MQSWIMVIMLWNAGGPAVTVAPGLYEGEGRCNIAAGRFNDQSESMHGTYASAICIPGPTVVLTRERK